MHACLLSQRGNVIWGDDSIAAFLPFEARQL